jgi:DNA excision repair protein ERCC-3
MPPKKRGPQSSDYDEDNWQVEPSYELKIDRRGRKPKVNASSNFGFETSFGEDTFSTFQDLSTTLTLKPDHEKRPIWITASNVIILESFSKYYAQAYDFLIDIAEPLSRPTYFQTYQLTEDSLYSAVAVSRSTESIIKFLNILCKTDVPSEVETFIRNSTSTFGKVIQVKNSVVLHVILFA